MSCCSDVLVYPTMERIVLVSGTTVALVTLCIVKITISRFCAWKGV